MYRQVVMLVVYTSCVNWVSMVIMVTALPAYREVIQHIQTRISEGVWRAGDAVPSENDLMRQFGVSRMTINHAMRELLSKGLIRRVKGSGTFVAELSPISSRLILRDIHEEIVERGHAHSCRILHCSQEHASVGLARSLGLRKGSAVYHSTLLHLENGHPILLEDRYVNPAVSPDYLGLDWSQITPTQHLLQVAPITQASYAIEACMPSTLEAIQLRIDHTEPCLVMVRRTVSGAHVASLARHLYPASRYRFEGQFEAGSA